MVFGVGAWWLNKIKIILISKTSSSTSLSATLISQCINIHVMLVSQHRSSHRDSFRKYLFFFSRSNLFIIFQEGPSVRRTDMNFPGGSICSSNRHKFSRRTYRKDNVFSRRFYLFRTDLIISSNRY